MGYDLREKIAYKQQVLYSMIEKTHRIKYKSPMWIELSEQIDKLKYDINILEEHLAYQYYMGIEL